MATGVAYDRPEAPGEAMDVDPVEEKGGDDTAFLAAIRSAESTAYGGEDDGGLSTERAASIDDYLGRPYGNEQEGRSQVISRDVYDTIEWIKPSLLRIFTSGDEVARFDPVGPEDEEAAQQESDYINHVIQDKNPWFAIAYEWFTDALMTKNAYAMAYWDTSKQVETEQYTGITDDQLAMMLMDGQVELVEHSAEPGQMQGPMGEPAGMLHDVKVRRTHEYKGVKICVLPPERCLVSEAVPSMSVRSADFFEYWESKTISEVRQMGFDIPDDIKDSAGEAETLEDTARDQFDENQHRNDSKPNDPSLRKVRVRMVWIKFDYDGDGIAEHRRAIVIGNRILSNEDSTGVQVAAIVPTPFPHRHPGLSVRDMVTDLQGIKTDILRATLDNLALANNGRTGISDKVNLDDMLTSRPGGVVRVEGGGVPSQHIMPFVHPFVAGQSLTVLQYLDQVREARTGTSQAFTGVDANSLEKSHSGVAIAQLTSAAAQRVETIARVFAEGVKELFLIVHELCLKHGHQEQVVRLKGKWVTVDPSQWKRRNDMRISVGLGTGNKEQLMVNVSGILQMQKEAIQIGATSPKKIYNALVEFTKAAGFPSPEKFWDEPPEGPMQQPPNPEEIKAKTQLAQEEMRQRGETERTLMEIQSKERIELARIESQSADRAADRASGFVSAPGHA